MAIMVKKLYKNGTFLYNMNLIAGKNGLTNLVNWVHIIEDEEVISFLHGNELVFTAGIRNKHKDWLINFARDLHAANASAFVVNIGPHTTEVPQAVIEYCNSVNLPLFTIPWVTRMVDMTRDFCHRIMNNNKAENDLATTIQNIIFNVGDFETQVLQMERYGFRRDSQVCFFSIAAHGPESAEVDENMDVLDNIAERIAKNMHELYISFSYKDTLVLALFNYADAEIKVFVNDFLRDARKATSDFKFYFGISSNHTGLYNQNKNFEKAAAAMEIAHKLKMPYCFYDKMGIYKILYAVNDKAILRSFYKDALGELVAYDRENNTQLVKLLRAYLENNGSLQIVAEQLYIHRNTVTNQLKKIETVSGYDPFEMEDRMRFYIGFYVMDMLF